MRHDSFFNMRQRHRGPRPPRVRLRLAHFPQPKGRIEGLREGGVECVEVETFCPGRKAVEGQSARRLIQVHPHPPGVGRRRRRHGRWRVVVPGSVTLCRAEHAPGLSVPPDAAVVSVPSPLDPSVGHSHIHHSLPLHLPVAAAAQPLGTQQLLPAVKPLRMVRIRLLLLYQLHPSVVFREPQVSVGCVQVQREQTKI